MRELNIPYCVNTRLVRGLRLLWSHCFLKLQVTSLAQSTVCGGGRYDGLVERLGGEPTPAIGWALGMERLLLLLDAASSADPNGVAARLKAHPSPTVLLGEPGKSAEVLALRIALNLRRSGISVENLMVLVRRLASSSSELTVVALNGRWSLVTRKSSSVLSVLSLAG